MKPYRAPLLLTRPDEASRRFSALFRARGAADWPVVVAPLMQTVLLTPPLPDGRFDGLVFTSETAVLAYRKLSPDRSLPAYCVGQRTAAVAADAGFTVRVGPGDAPGLARILAGGGVQRLLYPCGTHVAHDMAALLKAVGTEVIGLAVYDQQVLKLSAAAQELLSGALPVLLPIFSARSARLLAGAMMADHAPLRVAAISAEVAAKAEPLAAEVIRVAQSPDADTMVTLLWQMANQPELG